MIIALLVTLNIKGLTEKYFLPIAVLHILNHWSVRWSNLPTSPLDLDSSLVDLV